MIGKQIDGKYSVIGQLGSGAMGTVYEGRHITTGRAVAIKVISGELGRDPALVSRFQREARAAGSIDSTHIAQVLDAGQDPATGAPYLVMELLRGEDLECLVRRLGPLRYGLALRIIAQALSALERAHAAQVIHRDIKPANLYIAQSDDGHRVVKLVDFGIAKVKDEFAASNHALTQTSALLGSPLYMSPEQAKASKKVDPRADLWSLGVVLFQLLSGKAPHAHAESLTELLLAICTETARPVQEMAPWVPPEVARIVERALRLDANQRFSTAAEMRAAIAEIVPDWNVLSDVMLTPLSAEERSFVAESAGAPTTLGIVTGEAGDRRGEQVPLSRTLAADAAAAPSGTGGKHGRSSPSLGGATVLDPLPSSAASQPAALAASGTSSSFAGTNSGAKRPSRTLVPFAIGGLLIVAVGGVGLRKMLAHGETSAPAGGLVAQASLSASAPSEPVQPDAGAITATPAAVPPAPASGTAQAARPITGAPVPGAGSVRVRPQPPSTSSASTATTPPHVSATATPSARPATPAAPATKPVAPSSSSPISRDFN